MAPVLDEQSRRRFAAMEALSLGHGGVSAISRISGLARSTINRGIADIRAGASAPAGRIRKPGGGRKRKVIEDPTLLGDLKKLVEPCTRGDPMQPLLWSSLSLRKLVNALAEQGHKVSASVVGELLHGQGYSLQANSKVKEGGGHIDRDAQFRYINAQAKRFLAADEPVVSVDTKKKELVGNFKNNGRQWRPQGQPDLVNVHDFIDPKLPRAVPYGVYDITNNLGWVLDAMAVRNFSDKTRHDYVRHIKSFASFLGRSPDTASADDLRRFQLHQRQNGVQPSSMNSAVSALRFFFSTTLTAPTWSGTSPSSASRARSR